eukprot:m.98403 g.98403  ORF g.98403 m.98403 type:complete len:610 (+) comp13634_c0_seq1:217-2046(+)
MLLPITEKWIRDRVNLPFNQLHNVRSLMLPGTAEEKITHLGSSLQNFTRLKHIDLSNNLIVSLEGLSTLIMLEKLNLYMNKIPNLTEIVRLRHNQNLRSVDLRLNPISNRSQEYRMVLIHLIPNLTHVDNLDVTTKDRSAALQYFTTDQAVEFTTTARPQQEQRQQQATHSHQQQAPGTGGFASTLLHSSGQQQSKRRPSAPSQEMPDIPMDMIDSLLFGDEQHSSSTININKPNHNDVFVSSDLNMTAAPSSSVLYPQEQRQQRLQEFDEYNGNNTNLRGAALHTLDVSKNSLRNSHTTILNNEPQVMHRSVSKRHVSVPQVSLQQEDRELPPTAARAMTHVIDQMIPMIHQYYRPGHSLSVQFQVQVHALLERALVRPLLKIQNADSNSVQNDLEKVCQLLEQKEKEVLTVTEEFRSLESALLTMLSGSSDEDDIISKTKLSSSERSIRIFDLVKMKLNRYKQDLTSVRQTNSQQQEEITRYTDKESQLKSEIRRVNQQLVEAKEMSQAASSQAVHSLKNELEKSKRETERLKEELAKRKENDGISEGVTEEQRNLLAMLQDSHRTLTEGNERLVQQLEQQRLTHSKELEQMRWNYNELKRTADLLR